MLRSSQRLLLAIAMILTITLAAVLVTVNLLSGRSIGRLADTASPSVTKAATFSGETTSRDKSRDRKFWDRKRTQEKVASAKEPSPGSAPEPVSKRTDEQPLKARSDEGRNSEVLTASVESITGSYPGIYGVLVWQPASGKRVAVNADGSFPAASLAKLPVLLALYREAAEGTLELDEPIQILPTDVQPGTGVLKHRPPGTIVTLRECAYHLISNSDNTAWRILERRLGEWRIFAELANIGAYYTNYGYARHTTTPEDVLKMLTHISDPGYTSPALSEEMLSAMTDTAFEDRLPRGVPEDARVAHKIGILGDSFADAGVVYPQGQEEGAYYIVVLSDSTTEQASRAAMQEISRAAYESLAGSEQ